MDCELVSAFDCEFSIPGQHSHLKIRYENFEYFHNVFDTASTYTHNNMLRAFKGGIAQGGGYMITYCQCITLSSYTTVQKIYKSLGFFGGHNCILPHSHAKVHVRDLLTVVKYFHDRGCSFGWLQLFNVVIVEGTLKLVGVCTFPLDNACKTQDFHSIASIIRFLYNHRGQSIPAEFMALITLLESEWQGVRWGKIFDYSMLIYDHPSTWNMGRRESFMRHICDWLLFLEDGQETDDYNYALQHLNLPWPLRNWQSRIPTGSPLAACLEYEGVHYNNSVVDLALFIRNAFGHLAVYSDEREVNSHRSKLMTFCQVTSQCSWLSCRCSSHFSEHISLRDLSIDLVWRKECTPCRSKKKKNVLPCITQLVFGEQIAINLVVLVQVVLECLLDSGNEAWNM